MIPMPIRTAAGSHRWPRSGWGRLGDGGWIGAVLLGKSKASYHGRYSDTRQSCANH